MPFIYGGPKLQHHVTDYQSAFALWEESRLWKHDDGTGDDRRKLGDSDKNYNSVRKCKRAGCDDVIAFEYHDTDVVCYNPDGTLTINAYNSASTSRFIYILTPHDFLGHMTLGESHNDYVIQVPVDPLPKGSSMWYVPSRMYRAHRSSTWRRDEAGRWQSADTTPWDWPVVVAAKARAAVQATRFSDFQHWLRGAWHMRGSLAAHGRHRHHSHPEVYEMLADRTQWLSFLDETYFHSLKGVSERPRAWMKWNEEHKTSNRDWYINANINRTLDLVRKAIYHHSGSVITQERDYLANAAQVKLYYAKHREFDWI